MTDIVLRATARYPTEPGSISRCNVDNQRGVKHGKLSMSKLSMSKLSMSKLSMSLAEVQ